MQTQDKDKSPTRRPGLIALPFLILAALLIAPPTRVLLQAQLGLLHDITPLLARLCELGVKEGPPGLPLTWEKSPAEASVARLPNDYTIQLGGALLKAAYTNDGIPTTP